MSLRKFTRAILGPLAFFALLTFLMMHDILLNVATHVAGPESDFYQFHWNFWWEKYALFHLNQSVFSTNFVHAPFELNLGYHTLTLNWLPSYLLLEPILGNIFAVNLLFWFNLTLSGFFAFVFLRSERLSAGLSLFGSVLFVVTPYIIFHISLFHLNLMALFWLPLLCLVWKKIIETQAWWWGLAMGFGLWLAWLNDGQWLLWLAFVLGPYALLTLIRQPRPRLPRIIGLGLLAIGVLFALAWFIGPLQPMRNYEGYVQPAPLANADYWSLELRAFWGQPGLQDQAISVLVVPLIIISLFFTRRQRERWLWLGMTLLLLVLALGPSLTLNNQRYTLPYHTLHNLLDGMYRAPIRFVPVALLTAALFIGLSVDTWFRQTRPHTKYFVVGSLLFFLLAEGHIFAPMQIYRIPTYALYDEIGQDKDEQAVLIEVPLGVTNGWNAVGDYWPTEQYYGILHHKRMVNGSVSREPTDNYLFYELSPLWNWLAGNQALDFAAASQEFVQYQAQWPIGYVIVDQNERGPHDPQTLEWLQFFNTLPDVCFWQEEQGLVAYRTAHVANGCVVASTSSIDVGSTDLGQMGLGWYWPENFGGKTSRWMSQVGHFYVAPPTTMTRMTIEALAFDTPRTVTIYVDGKRVSDIEVTTDGWQRFELPLTLSEAGVMHLQFSAETVGNSGDGRELSIAVSEIVFE